MLTIRGLDVADWRAMMVVVETRRHGGGSGRRRLTELASAQNQRRLVIERCGKRLNDVGHKTYHFEICERARRPLRHN
jgi:hypothetical protein